MIAFVKTYKLSKEKSANFDKKLADYLRFYDFSKKESDANSYTYYKKGSILDGWKFSPLAWEAEIKITLIDEKSISINYKNFGNGQITPAAFTPLFQSFFENLILFIDNDADFQLKNKEKISQAKRKKFFPFSFNIIRRFWWCFSCKTYTNRIQTKFIFNCWTCDWSFFNF